MSDRVRLGHLARAIARRERMADVLTAAHEQALAASGGRSSVILRLLPGTRELYGLSAAGLDELDPAPWLTSRRANAAAERAWNAAEPIVVKNLPELTTRLPAKAAILAPLLHHEHRLGMLALGVDDPARATESLGEIAAIADLLAIALEDSRLRVDAQVQKEVRALGINLARSVSSALDLHASLEIYCDRRTPPVCRRSRLRVAARSPRPRPRSRRVVRLGGDRRPSPGGRAITRRIAVSRAMRASHAEIVRRRGRDSNTDWCPSRAAGARSERSN